MIPEKYQQMLEKGVDVVALRVAMIGELDRKNANVVAIGDALNEVLKAKGLSLFEDDDEVVDFAVGANADAKLVEIKASLRMNFSREKIVFASQLIGGSVKRTATGIKKMSEPREDSKIVQLKRSAVAGDKVPDKVSLRAAIIGEIDKDSTRAESMVLKAAELADEELRKAGINDFFEEDDESIAFLYKDAIREASESALTEVKASLRMNFSRKKLEYAKALIAEYRRRGMRDFQPKAPLVPRKARPTEEGSSGAQYSRERDRAAETGHETPRPTGSNTIRTVTWAMIAAAVLTVVALIIKKIRQ